MIAERSRHLLKAGMNEADKTLSLYICIKLLKVFVLFIGQDGFTILDVIIIC